MGTILLHVNDGMWDYFRRKAYATGGEWSTRIYLRSYLSSCCFAQDAASEITGSGSRELRSAIGISERSRLLPIAIKAFRRSPERLVRLIGEPRKVSRNSSSEISASHAKAGFTSPSRA